MTAYFNFPNLAAAKVEIDAVPQVGHMVNPLMIEPGMFEREKDWQKYEHWEYSKFTFKVIRIVWSPAPNGRTYVNIFLERIP